MEDENGNLHSEKNGQFVSKEDSKEKLDEAEQIYNSERPVPSLKEQQDDDSEDDGAIDRELSDLLGEEFKGVKGQEAIDKLLQEKRGHVKGAFHRDDIGDIDLLWGDDHVGLQHIIVQREKEKQGHAQEVLSNLSEAIENATYKKRNDRGNFEYSYKKDGLEYKIIIAPEWHNEKITYLLTAFRRGKKRNK